jgi:hypothetical protein
VLTTMSDGAIHIHDPVVKKTCIRFFRELVDQLARPNLIDDGNSRGFLAFLCQIVIPGVFQSMLSRSFNERDATSARAVSEFGNVLLSIKSKSELNDLYQQCIGNMQSLGPFPPETVDVLRNASSSDGIEACLHQILGASKIVG